MIRIKKYFSLFLLSAGIVFIPPLFACAQTVKGILNEIANLVQLLIPVLIALALAVFIFGVFRFIAASGSADKVTKAKGFIIWGLVGIFILISFWGLIQILLSTFFGSSSPPGQPGNWPPQFSF